MTSTCAPAQSRCSLPLIRKHEAIDDVASAQNVTWSVTYGWKYWFAGYLRRVCSHVIASPGES